MGGDSAKKIITYGLRYSDFDTQRHLFALRNNGDIEIVAEIGYDSDDPEIFYKRMSVEQGLSLDHDMLIVCDGTPEEAKICLGKERYADKAVKLCDISALTEPHFIKVKQTQLNVLRDIVDSPDENVRNRDWLKKKLYEYGFFPFFKLVKEPETGIVWSTTGILQVPDEFTDFCLFLMDYRIDSAIEIGVARGASSYIMAALMYRNNPDMKYHMVDINDGLESFDEAKLIIPSLENDIPKTSDDFVGKEFDFCFIDADHSYDGMMLDWRNVGVRSRVMTVFHDIYAHEYDPLNGGTVRGWQEIRDEMNGHRIREFSKYPDKWMGIGVVEF